MKRILGVLSFAALGLLVAGSAFAWSLHGTVFCEGTGLPLSGVTINVVSTDAAGFSGSAVTDDAGEYLVILPDVPGAYSASPTLDASESVISPASGTFLFATTSTLLEFTQDWVIASPSCANERCWLTGGGAKYSPITGSNVGQVKDDNFGGNVNPGCSATAGDGGNWNDIVNELRLHFQGTSIQVIRCGNVDGIPPGSTSPATPFNFIDFQGTGSLKGIKGNKADYGLVYFFAHCEDRNEPGSNGQRDGAGKDRYFLNVYTNPADPVGSSVVLVDVDGDPSTVDPVTITDGNLQIHVSSCDTPPVTTLTKAASKPAPVETGTLPTQLAFARVGPNPAVGPVAMQFALPAAGSVSLRVYDVAGREVSALVSDRLEAGFHTATWDLRDRDGAPVSGGVYFARLTAAGQSVSKVINVAR